jgi:hypothetical protein
MITRRQEGERGPSLLLALLTREPGSPMLLKVCDVHESSPATRTSEEIPIRRPHPKRVAPGISHPTVFPPGRFPWGPARRTTSGTRAAAVSPGQLPAQSRGDVRNTFDSLPV